MARANDVGGRAMGMEVRRRRRGTERRWLDSIRDIREKGLSGGGGKRITIPRGAFSHRFRHWPI